MEAIDIVSLILMRFSKNGTASFKANNNASAYWMTTQGEQPVQIRMSNRKATMDEWKERPDPSVRTNISIVFFNDNHIMAEDDKDSIPSPAELQISVETDNQGEPFIVREYTYQCQGIGCGHIRAITDAIVQAAATGEYKDPFRA